MTTIVEVHIRGGRYFHGLANIIFTAVADKSFTFTIVNYALDLLIDVAPAAILDVFILIGHKHEIFKNEMFCYIRIYYLPVSWP